MSETYGTIVIPNFAGLTSEEVKAIPEQSEGFAEALFKHGGFNLRALAQGSYGITDAALKEGYIQLSSMDPDWVLLANSAMRSDRHIELYASFHDEYGSCRFFIKNPSGETFSYGFDQEGDEFDQDDFDYQDYLDSHKKSAEKWLGLCPAIVKECFPDVLAYPPDDFEGE